MSARQQAASLLAEHGVVVEADDIRSDGFGQFIAETEDGRFVVSLGGYPAPFIERELPTKRLGVRQRVRLERPEQGQE